MRSDGWQAAGWNNPKPAPGTLSLVQDFVNTRNYFHGGDLLGAAEDATFKLAELGLLEENEQIEEPERQRLVVFREGLRGLLLANNGLDEPGMAEPGAGVAGLNDLSDTAVLRVRFGPDRRPVLEPAAGDGVEGRIFGRLLAEAVRADAEGRWERLRACRNEGCMWAFYDASKNGMGRWCNMDVCGARYKMRRYRERKSGRRSMPG